MTATQRSGRATAPAVETQGAAEGPYIPKLLGVINLSPESRVADSIARSPEQILERAGRLHRLGVAILDLGGRSITPDAVMIDDAGEQARLAPAVEALRREGYRISVDTWSAETARAALRWGAEMVNYTAEELPDALLTAAAAAGASLVLTYMPYGDAYRMRTRPREPYRIERILDYMGPRIERARAAGIREVVVDPNLGIIHPDTDDYEKIHLQHEVLWNSERLRSLGCPLLLYAARKPERLARIMMASAVLHTRPEYIRTHEPETILHLMRAASETRN